MTRLFPVYLPALLLLAACPEPHDELVHFDGPISTARLDVDRGDVVVHAEDLADLTVHDVSRGADVTWQAGLDGTVFELSAGCNQTAAACMPRFDVAIPLATDIEARVDAGDLTIMGVRAAVDVEVLRGDISLRDLEGEVGVDLSSGDVALRDVQGAIGLDVGLGDAALDNVVGPLLVVQGGQVDLTGTELVVEDVRVQLDAGDVDLSFVEAPVALSVQVDRGDIRLTVPGGAWALDVSTSQGDVTVDGVQDTDEAERTIRVRLSRGDLTILGR